MLNSCIAKILYVVLANLRFFNYQVHSLPEIKMYTGFTETNKL